MTVLPNQDCIHSLAVSADSTLSYADRSSKIPGFDLLRFIAVCAIAWFHVLAPGSGYLQWRLIALMLLSISLAANKTSRPFLESVSRRGQRMLIPFLFWSGVYAMPILYQILRHRATWSQGFNWRMLLCGTTLSLWYLPFAFGATLAAERLSSLFKKMRLRNALVVLTLAGTALLLICDILWKFQVMSAPFSQYIYSLPAIPFGMAMGISIRRFKPEKINWGIVSVSALVIVVSVVFELAGGAHRMPLLTRYMWGSTVFAICSMMLRTPAFLSKFTPLAMGVYLIHPAFILVGYKIGFQAGTTVFGIFVVYCSILSAWIAYKTPLRWVMGGL